MTTTRLRTTVAVSVSALLLMPLGACGTADGASKDAAARSTPSASVSEPASTNDTSTSEPAASSGDAGRLTKATFAEVMARAVRENKSAHMSMQVGSTMSMEADVAYGDGTPEMRATMGMGGQKMTMVLAGGVFYLQMPGATPGGKWMKIDPKAPGMGALMGQLGGMGPQGMLEAMDKGVQDVEFVGSEDVAGEELDHYRVTVDPSATLDQLGALAGQVDAQQLPDKVTYDLYVDDENLMRQVDMDIMGQHMVMKISDWGKAVDIKAPPAAQVVEMPYAGRG